MQMFSFDISRYILCIDNELKHKNIGTGITLYDITSTL